MRCLPSILLAALIGTLLCVTVCCSGRSSSENDTLSNAEKIVHPLPDTLRVATLYSPGSYFIYRETQMGYDYDLVEQLAQDKGMVLDLQVAPTLKVAVEMLDSGKVDLIAYEVPVTAEYLEHIVPCGPENITTQVLVQPRQRDGLITDVTQLAGREVYVEEDSKYQHRLVNLNDEIGGGIVIHPISRSSMITEDLIDLVSRDSIPLTIVDSDIARINQTYYPNLDITLEVSFPQRSQWAVSSTNKWLGDTIDAWLGQESPRQAQAALLKRYFEMGKTSRETFDFSFSGNRISRYDHIFKRYSPEIGWDWRLLASMGYAESRFDSTLVSWAGASGLMQIMPKTARAFGLSDSEMTNNDRSIATAVKIIKSLDGSLKDKVRDPVERRKFVVAAYNSGLAHILDAIALAKKHGLNPAVWNGNVSAALMMKSNPEYYNDPVCRYGYFRGRETIEYVERVYGFYDKACAKVSK